MNAAISITNLKKTYGDFSLDIPELQIETGYITGFIGENGAGKTTAMRLIMDVIRPEAGEIHVFGSELRQDPASVKSRIGFVESMSCFSPSLKVGHVKKIVAPFFPEWSDELYNRYCSRFEIPQDSRVRALSSGKSKLFSLIVALSHSPELLILDEPTSNLDPVARSEMLDLFHELLQDGKTTILYSTHITSDLDKTADYIVYIHRGKILLNEEKDALLSRNCIIRGDNALLDRADGCPLHGIRKTSVGFTALCSDRSAAEKAFGDCVVLEQPNIEDIMLHLSKEA